MLILTLMNFNVSNYTYIYFLVLLYTFISPLVNHVLLYFITATWINRLCYIFFRVAIIPLGYKLGIRRKKVIHVDPNPALETTYKTNKKIDDSTYQVLPIAHVQRLIGAPYTLLFRWHLVTF